MACEEGCARMVWQVADWNDRAAKFYQKVGGKIIKEWLTVRMLQPQLGMFASGEDSTNKCD